MRMIVVFLLCIASAFAIDKVTTPYTAVSKAVISAAGTNQNRDSLRNAVNRTIDTVNTFVPRWVQVLRGDSIFHKANIDTISHSPVMDTILANPLYVKGRIVVDTIAGTTSSSTTATHDSIYTRAIRVTAAATIDSVNVRALAVKKLKLDSLTFNSISYLKTYIDTIFPCSLFDNTTYRASNDSGRIIQIGNVINLYLPIMMGTISSQALLKNIPSKFKPATAQNIPVQINNGGTYSVGILEITPSNVHVFTSNGSSDLSGTSGIGGQYGGITAVWTKW